MIILFNRALTLQLLSDHLLTCKFYEKAFDMHAFNNDHESKMFDIAFMNNMCIAAFKVHSSLSLELFSVFHAALMKALMTKSIPHRVIDFFMRNLSFVYFEGQALTAAAA